MEFNASHIILSSSEMQPFLPETFIIITKLNSLNILIGILRNISRDRRRNADIREI